MTWTEPSLKGKLILDAGGLSGSFFSRTVTLICRHNEEGAFGLTLNRLSGNQIGEAIIADLPESILGTPLFLGGPVQPSVMTFLYLDSQLDGDEGVIEGVGVGNSLEKMLELEDQGCFANQRIRVFSGYSGWSPGQLESELARDSWIVLPCSIEGILKVPPENLWSQLLKTHGDWKWQLLAQSPEDPSVN